MPNHPILQRAEIHCVTNASGIRWLVKFGGQLSAGRVRNLFFGELLFLREIFFLPESPLCLKVPTKRIPVMRLCIKPLGHSKSAVQFTALQYMPYETQFDKRRLLRQVQ